MTTDNSIRPSEWTPVVEAVGAAIRPLVESQNEAQKRTVEADVEKHRVSVLSAERTTKWALTMVALAIAGLALVTWKLIDSGNAVANAYHAMVFVSGAGFGFGIGRVRK